MSNEFSDWDKDKIHTFRNGIRKLAEDVRMMKELFNLDTKTILAFVLMEVEEAAEE